MVHTANQHQLTDVDHLAKYAFATQSSHSQMVFLFPFAIRFLSILWVQAFRSHLTMY